jgi:hypothetical protein
VEVRSTFCPSVAWPRILTPWHDKARDSQAIVRRAKLDYQFSFRAGTLPSTRVLSVFLASCLAGNLQQSLCMCGRYRLSRRKQLVEEYFGTVSEEYDWNPRYNVAPSQPVLIIRPDAREPVRKVSAVRWGLILSWSKDPSIGYKTINGRSETVATTLSFRDPFKSQRCLVPADGFYEWSRHEAACVIVRRAPLDRTCHPIGSTLRGMAIR